MGIRISVLRPADMGGADCTNGGISSRYNTLTVVNASGPFEPDQTAPPVLMERHVSGCLRLVMAYKSARTGKWETLPGHSMMGGNYGATSDSRFPALAENLLGHRFYGAVAIHDRYE